ncbi:MAG: hypothetical protein ABJF23_34230 [Bryobacteraceae bacterium]
MKIRTPFFYLIVIPMVLLADKAPEWTSKPAAQWTETEAQTILTDSPWAKQVSPTVERSSNRRQEARNPMGQIAKIGIGGLGGPRGSGGGRNRRQSQTQSERSSPEATVLTVRWENALPVQEAHLKLADVEGPAIDEKMYSVAVLSVPHGWISGKAMEIEKHLKSQGELRCAGKKTIHSTRVRVFEQDHGMLIVFRFPKTSSITTDDADVEFAAHIGAGKLVQSFSPKDMVFQGKLEL